MTAAIATHALSAAQLHAYERDGYLFLRGLFADEASELADEAERLRARADLATPENLRTRWQRHVETGAMLFEVFDPVVDIAPVCARVAVDPRLAGVLASLYGGQPCLFKDKLIYKPPGAVGYQLHQDFIAWPGFPPSFVTVVIAIDPFTAQNGNTEVFAGCHRQGYLSPADGKHHPIPDGVLDEARAVPLDLRPGDVALFGCFTPHRSAPNRSTDGRRGLFLSYNARSDGGPQREKHYQQFRDYLTARSREQGRTDVTFR
jgi:ectoine hydroxylase-related dioxygenase (phytanoyl-CoA dioxygenase family)